MNSKNKILNALIKEFEFDADSKEKLATVYQNKGLFEQSIILMHEGTVYRNCADRLKQELN